MGDEGRRWFEKRKDFVYKVRTVAEDDRPDWTRCPSCDELTFNETLLEQHMVCPLCSHHYRIGALHRLQILTDPDSLQFHDEELKPVDALNFVDSKRYSDRIVASRKKTGRNEAFMSASATMDGIPVEIGCLDFAFMGGSMGSVVGEQITRLYERALERKRPAIIISASGGARMQEGVLSLMQMAKTSAALSRLQDAGLPYISVLTHPTTGGVAASFAMLGDLIVAEPQALIGFAGARVIKQTIGQDLPEGFQTSEYLLDHGAIDAIVPRAQLRSMLVQVLSQLLGLPPTLKRLPSEEVPMVAAGSRAAAAGGPTLSKPGD